MSFNILKFRLKLIFLSVPHYIAHEPVQVNGLAAEQDAEHAHK